jgi:hypothetical protein
MAALQLGEEEENDRLMSGLYRAVKRRRKGRWKWAAAFGRQAGQLLGLVRLVGPMCTRARGVREWSRTASWDPRWAGACAGAEKGKEAELGCFWRRAKKVKGKDKKEISFIIFKSSKL